MIPTEQNKPKGGSIQSISRAAAILRCFREKKKLGLTEISKMTGLHKSTASGLIHTLKEERFLEQDPETSLFCLGLDFFFWLPVQSLLFVMLPNHLFLNLWKVPVKR